MPRPWTFIEAERALKTAIFQVRRQRLRSPRTGRDHDFWVLDCVDWCNVVPVTADGQVVMVRQQRHGTRELTLEVPGGMVDPGETPLEAAGRELFEETGYRARELRPTGQIAPNPAMQSNRCHSFIAHDVELAVPEGAHAQHQDHGEDIEVVLVPLTEIPERIARGEISHALVVVAFAYSLGISLPGKVR